MTTSEPWLGDAEAKPAPEPLRTVQALINTVDLESGRDRLGARADAEPWLVAHGLVPDGVTVGQTDLDTLVAFREALRGLLVHHTAGTVPATATIAELNAVAADAAVTVTVDDTGAVRVGAVGDSVRDALAGMLLVIEAAQRDGTWSHLKACANDECRWAFYDRSRNHGGTWCDMSACGNRLKNRDFRARRRTAR